MDNTKNGLYTNYSYASQGRATAWQVAPAQTGVFLRTLPPSGVQLPGDVLCRIADGSIFFWDRRKRQEIEISIDQLLRYAQG